jgi:hypothetical protein
VLTNFAQLHFIRVNEETPSFSFKLNELIARREELWELLALENVEANRIDELYDQQHKSELDKRFLADLKRWRIIIANGFALRKPSRPRSAWRCRIDGELCKKAVFAKRTHLSGYGSTVL